MGAVQHAASSLALHAGLEETASWIISSAQAPPSAQSVVGLTFFGSSSRHIEPLEKLHLSNALQHHFGLRYWPTVCVRACA